MFEGNSEGNEFAGGAAPRRERLDRIANAERDRREGRVGMAVASIGEPVEWPARVVVALARLPDWEGIEARRVLEQGLDAWARDFDLGDLNQDLAAAEESASTADDLSQPIEASELDLAFENAQTEVESMRSVNSVAEQILADEPIGIAELQGGAVEASDSAVDSLGESLWAEPDLDAATVWEDEPSTRAASSPSQDLASQQQQLTTLERWLGNIEQRRARRSA